MGLLVGKRVGKRAFDAKSPCVWEPSGCHLGETAVLQQILRSRGIGRCRKSWRSCVHAAARRLRSGIEQAQRCAMWLVHLPADLPCARGTCRGTKPFMRLSTQCQGLAKQTKKWPCVIDTRPLAERRRDAWPIKRGGACPGRPAAHPAQQGPAHPGSAPPWLCRSAPTKGSRCWPG